MHVFLCEVGKFVSLIPDCVYSVVHTIASVEVIGENKATNKNRFCRLGSYVAGAEVPGLLQPDPLHMQFSGFTSELSDVLHSKMHLWPW